MESKKVYIRPEDVIRLVLKNIKDYETIEDVEDNLKKMLWYFEDERLDKLKKEFGLKI